MAAQSRIGTPVDPAGSDPEDDGVVIARSLHDPEQFAVVFRRHAPDVHRALGDIPGVTVDHHAVDVAGRNGIGFTLPSLAGGAIDEIVINPRTYHLMGQQLIASQPAGSAGQVLSGTAILRRALVSGPGVRP